MRKIFLLFLTLCFATNLYSQVEPAEPDFTGEVLWKNNDETTMLEKSTVQIETKAGAGVYIVGIGSVKTRIKVEGGSANVRIKQSGALQFIVRAIDNKSDPLSIVKLFKFDKRKKDRRAELSGTSTFGGVSQNNLKLHGFSAKKYGESSYLITLNSLEEGEYGIIVSNPNALDERSTIVSCFGIDKAEGVNEVKVIDEVTEVEGESEVVEELVVESN